MEIQFKHLPHFETYYIKRLHNSGPEMPPISRP